MQTTADSLQSRGRFGVILGLLKSQTPSEVCGSTCTVFYEFRFPKCLSGSGMPESRARVLPQHRIPNTVSVKHRAEELCQIKRFKLTFKSNKSVHLGHALHTYFTLVRSYLPPHPKFPCLFLPSPTRLHPEIGIEGYRQPNMFPA